MGFLDKQHIENKQISIDDVIRLSNMLEEYKEEWIQKAKEEEERVNSIPSDKKVYDSIESEVTYTIFFEDGRTLKEKGFDWLYNNIEEIDTIKNIDMYYRLGYWDYTNDGIHNSINIYVNLNLKYSEDQFYPKIKIDVSSNNIDQEANIIHKQLNNFKSECEENEKFTKNDIIKFAQILESYKKEWLDKAEEEKKYIQSLPSKEKQYENLDFKIEYSIRWYDGREKEEKSQEWFLENIKDYKNISRIQIRAHLSYWDNVSEGNRVYKTLESWINFYVGEDNYNSYARYDVDASNMEQEADILHSKIKGVFVNNDIRYDKTIKNRFLRIQSFSIAVGIVLSYILYIILKIALKDSDMVFVNLLNNKNFIIFGQWLIAVALGNILGSWFINLLYKPLLPEKRYAGYNKSSGKFQYKEKIDEYLKDSEIQLGKFSDLKQKRILIEKLYKIGLLATLIQVIISALLYLILN